MTNVRKWRVWCRIGAHDWSAWSIYSRACEDCSHRGCLLCRAYVVSRCEKHTGGYR